MLWWLELLPSCCLRVNLGLSKHKYAFNYYSSNDIQSNSVITNSSWPAIFVRYNRGTLITGLIWVLKWPISPQKLFVITECSLTSEFVITKFYCNLIIYLHYKAKNMVVKSVESSSQNQSLYRLAANHLFVAGTHFCVTRTCVVLLFTALYGCQMVQCTV